MGGEGGGGGEEAAEEDGDNLATVLFVYAQTLLCIHDWFSSTFGAMG